MAKMGGKTAAHTYWLSKRECLEFDVVTYILTFTKRVLYLTLRKNRVLLKKGCFIGRQSQRFCLKMVGRGGDRKLNQLRWQNMSPHLTNETSYWLKKFLMHLNWSIYNVCDLNIDPHVCFFPTLSQDRVRPIPLAQPEACPQRSERPVCAFSPHTEAETATQGDLGNTDGSVTACLKRAI